MPASSSSLGTLSFNHAAASARNAASSFESLKSIIVVLNLSRSLNATLGLGRVSLFVSGNQFVLPVALTAYVYAK